MDFGFSDEEESFRASVLRFTQDQLRPHYQADDRSSTFRREVLDGLAELGLLGLRVPGEFGGQDGSAVAAGIACEQVGYGDFNTGYVLINTALTADILVRNGTAEQQKRFLPPIASGEQLPSLAITEPEHGSDAVGLALRAEPDGDTWRLVGEKTSITLGTSCDTAMVFARTGPQGARGISAFYVELDDRFVDRSEFSDLGNRAIGRASLQFDGLPVGTDNLIGPKDEGFVGVMQGFDYSRALIGLLCLGAAQASLDEALAYSRDRRAFGQPIGSFQGVSFPLVEYQTQMRAARLLCYEALWRKDQGLAHTVEAAMVKWWAPKLSFEAAHQALLTHGHSGYSDELPLGQRIRDIVGLEIGDGTAGISKLVIARSLLGRDAAP